MMHRLMLLIFVLTLAGCASRDTGYQRIEEKITTRGGLLDIFENGVFHDALYNPESINLNFPGYIIGLDKSRRHAVDQNTSYPSATEDDGDGLRRVKQRMANDPKIHYISHILRNSGEPYGQSNCLIYTIYSEWSDSASRIEAGGAPADQCTGFDKSFGNPASAQFDSQKALSAFQRELQRAIGQKPGGYTHAVLMAMGWNTPQIEAIRNFNSITAHIKSAAKNERFEPLFVGVTWPSIWSAQWLDPAIKAISYKAKKDDADEVGTIWISLIANILKKEVDQKTQLVAIGHSFGARTIFSALCSKNVWGTIEDSRKWNLAIGWQPAFSIHRFIKDSNGDAFHYPHGCLDRIETIILTSSSNDKAVKTAFWADMIGSDRQWKSICEAQSISNQWNCIRSNQVGNSVIKNLEFSKGKINYVDASKIVFFLQPNTSGDAHSDIYRRVHGELNWRAMRE